MAVRYYEALLVVTFESLQEIVCGSLGREVDLSIDLIFVGKYSARKFHGF